MIVKAFEIIIQKLSNAGISAVLGNVSEKLKGLDESQAHTTDVIISIISIEENHVVRNTIRPENLSLTSEHGSAEIPLNIIFMVSPVASDNYAGGLQKIQDVIAFFYANPRLSIPDTNENPNHIRIVMLSLSLEQLHQVWSTLGSNYKPSLIYELRTLS